MSWDPVPLFPQFPGAAVPPAAFRTALYASTGGKEGIVGPTDVKVVPLDVPGTQVRVSAGAVLIVSRAVGGSQQTYSARLPDFDIIDVPETGSSGGRSYLVIARVEDPGMAGESWDDPVTAADGPYIFTRLVVCPAGTTNIHDVAGHANDSAVTLARIDMPASTATVTAGRIVDLRNIANPRSERVIQNAKLPTVPDRISLGGGFADFPSTDITGINVPSWATHAAIRMDTTVRAAAGDVKAQFQSFLTTGTRDATTLYQDLTLDFQKVGGGDEARQPLVVPSSGWWPVPAAIRGKAAKITSRVRAASGAAAGVIASSSSDYYVADITFTERPS